MKRALALSLAVTAPTFTAYPAIAQSSGSEAKAQVSAAQAGAICMLRSNADGSHAEIVAGPSQEASFAALDYKPTECAQHGRLAYRLSALCAVAEDYPAHAIPAFEKRYGVSPSALCEAGKRTAAELGVPFESEPALPAEARRLRAEIRARAKQSGSVLQTGESKR